MTQIGISAENFSERLGNGPAALVQQWPFADLIPRAEIKTDIGYGYETKSGIAVGRVMFASHTSVTFELDEREYRTAADRRVHLLLDDPRLSKSWQQIVGTTLAATVGVVSRTDGIGTLFRPERVLAIEPPLTHPSHPDAVPLTHRAGFVHGIVHDVAITYDEHTPAVIQLNTPDSDTPLTLNCLTEPHVSMPDGLTRDTILPGDIMRVGVAGRTEIRPDCFVANGTLHYLGRIAA